MIWNRRTACTCQYRSVVENNKENAVFTKLAEFLKEQDSENGLYKGNVYSIYEGKESGETEEKIKNQWKEKNINWIKCLADPENNEKACKEVGTTKDKSAKGTGCQAYDGMDTPKTKKGKKEGRGQGNEQPDSDYGSEADDKTDERFACSAYQAYPFNMGEDGETASGQPNEKTSKCRERFGGESNKEESQSK